MVAVNGPRPKRGGEEFTRSHYDDDTTASKKPRFDMRNPSALAPDAVDEDDVTLEADSIGRRGQQAKRNAVNIDGYHSDSSNEGFDARAATKAKSSKKPEKAKDEEQDDMFADLDEGEKDGDVDEEKDGKQRKKSVRFMAEDDIEGQADYSKGGGHVSMHPEEAERYEDLRPQDAASQSSSSESDVGDEARAGLDEDVIDEELGAGAKKKHAPRLDAFNLREEQEGGAFDESGNYVRKAADPDAAHDTWLEGVSKRDMRRAREAHAKREEERRQRTKEDDAKDAADVLRTLISNMELGETVLEALQRLNKGREKKKPRWQTQTKRKKQVEMDIDEEQVEEPAEKQKREAVEAITGAADLLLSRGEAEIYDTDRELLVRRFRTETGEEWVNAEEKGDDVAGKRWEYHWAGQDEVHGPYDRATMQAWRDAGYFGDGVEFRVVGEDGAGWTSALDL